MLALNETLFVEHKGADPEYPLTRAVASLANQPVGGASECRKRQAPPAPR
jgi:hypothetical protein